MQQGKIKQIGITEKVIQNYLTNSHSQAVLQKSNQEFCVLSPEIDIFEFQTVDSYGQFKNSFKTSDTISIMISYSLKGVFEDLRIGFDLYNSYAGDIIFRSFDDDIRDQSRGMGTFILQGVIPSNILKPGSYKVSLQVGIHGKKWITNSSIYVDFSIDLVDGVNARYSDNRPGVIMPVVDWIIQKDQDYTFRHNINEEFYSQ